MCKHFQTKDLGSFKYALDILKETNMIEYRPMDNPMDPNKKLMTGQGESFSNPKIENWLKKLFILLLLDMICLL